MCKEWALSGVNLNCYTVAVVINDAKIELICI